MDGRNAGSAVIGFVNGMYRIIFSFSTQKRKTEGKANLSLSLSFIPLREKNIHEDIFGMIYNKTKHMTTEGMKSRRRKKTKNFCYLEIKIK